MQPERFGSLVVMERMRGAKNLHATALCRCDCGLTRVVRQTRLRVGQVTTCARCALRNAWKKRSRRPAVARSNADAYDMYRSNAKRKGLLFQLSRSECAVLFRSACAYCGVTPTEKAGGIDRRDNERGYEPENVVACCSGCNYAKRNKTAVDFLGWVKRIARYQGY
jgi:hypothetical protein